MKSRMLIFAGFCLLWATVVPGARAQEGQEASPAASLASALGAACRQNGTQFANYLTAENAAAFRALPASERTAFLKRFSLVDDPGRPLVSNDPQGHTVLRCEAPAATTEYRFGAERVHENLAFIPVEVVGSEKTEFGMVREDGGWRMLSLGLLLLSIPELEKQWALQALEVRERAAIGDLEDLAEAIANYRTAFGKLPESLAELGPAPKNGVSPEAAQLVGGELAAGKKDGYLFRYRIVPSPGGDESQFELAATPIDYGHTGRRSFFLDAHGKLHAADKQGAVATADDPIVEQGKRE